MEAPTQTAVGQMLEPLFRTMPAGTARHVVDYEADAGLQERVEQLACKANEGELTSGERAEYESLIAAGDLLATMQAVARRTLDEVPVP